MQAAVGSFLATTNVSGTVSAYISGLAFDPVVVFLFGGTLRTADSSGGAVGDAEMWHGAIDANGNQFCFANAMDGNNAETYSLCSEDNCVMFIDADDGSLDGALAFDSIATGTVNLRVTRQFVANRVTFYLAIGGLPEGGNYKVGTFDAPTASSQQTVIDPNFKPQTLCLMASWQTDFDSLSTERMCITIGFVESDGTQGYSTIARSAGFDTVNTPSGVDACLHVATGLSTGVHVADFVGFTNKGFTLDWTVGGSAVTKKVGYVALSGCDFEVVQYTSPSNTSTTQVSVKATPVGMAALTVYEYAPSATVASWGAGFSDITQDRGHHFRSSNGTTTQTYRNEGCIQGARTPAGSYSLRFNAEIDAWDASTADVDVLTNSDSAEVPALLFFLSEAVPPPAVAGPNLRYVPSVAGGLG